MTGDRTLPLPLEGVRILAVSQFGAGPYCTMVLAELGAEIIKIEDPSVGGDISRSVPPYAIEKDSIYFQSFNRNKKSFTLNLKRPEGRKIFHDLVRVSNVVFNNLRGDLVTKLGLDYESLKEANGMIVCCSLSGFGTTGSRADEPGYDYLMQAYAGYMSMTGDPTSPPAACGVSVIDHAAGLGAALGLVAALRSAEMTGVGGSVEISLIDTAISMLTYLACWNLNKGYTPERRPGSAHQTLVPVQSFRTHDGYLVIFCGKEKFWRSLCTALEVPELADDERFHSFSRRRESRQLVTAKLQELFLTKTTKEWMDRLRQKVPCAPVNTLSEALSDPFLDEREMVVETSHPVFDRLKQVASPIKIKGTRMEHHRAPCLGEHTHQILRNYLGYDEDSITTLAKSGVI